MCSQDWAAVAGYLWRLLSVRFWAIVPVGGSTPMVEQFELLSRDATLHNVFFAALPDATMSASAGGTACDVRRRLRLSAFGNADPAGAAPCLAAIGRWLFRFMPAGHHRCGVAGSQHCFDDALQGRV